MSGALIVAASEKGKTFLCGLFQMYPFPVRAVSSSAEARRIFLRRPFELVVINAPLGDESGKELALGLCAEGAGVLLIVGSEHREEISEQMRDSGVYVLGKPFGRDTFHQALQMVFASNRRVEMLRQENQALHKKLEDNRIIDRAKMALMEAHGLSEAEAHRTIEKLAMDRRITKREAADSVLRALF